jgi:hypothetical protein
MSTSNQAISARNRIENRPEKPARVQRDTATLEAKIQNLMPYSFWSNELAKGRCSIERDTGYTQANTIEGSYFCLFFARGLCHLGPDCQKLHRLLTSTDIFGADVDYFGRKKLVEENGDILSINKTISIKGIRASENTVEVVTRHFGEWGSIERVRVLEDKGKAFIDYENEANA